MRLEYYQELEDKKFKEKKISRKRHKCDEASAEVDDKKRQCNTNSTDMNVREEIDNRKRQYSSDWDEMPQLKRMKMRGESFVRHRSIIDEVDVLSTSILNSSKTEAALNIDKPNRANSKSLKAKLLLNSKNLVAEERLINSIIELRKTGNEMLKSGDYLSAVDKYSQALQIGAKYSQLSALNLSNRALAMMKLNRFGDALSDCDAAIGLNSREIKAKLRRIKCLIELDRFDDAKSAVVSLKAESQLDECDQLLAVVVAKENFSQLLIDGEKLEQARDYGQAVASYSKAISIDANHGPVFQMRARVLFHLGRYRDALNDLNESLRLSPMDTAGPIFNRVGCLLKLERFTEAIHDAEQLHQRDPTAEHRDLLRTAIEAERRANKRNYYEILELDRDASVAQIKRQYRKMALVYHPDKLAEVDDRTRAIHEEKFKRLTLVLNTLTDPISRRMYDMSL